MITIGHACSVAAATLIALSAPMAAEAQDGGTHPTATVDGLTGPTTPRGVEDTELDSIHLEKEIAGMGNRRLRTRHLTIEPGGIVPVHSHADRPAMIYILQGTIHEHRNDRTDPVKHEAGDLSVEADVAHWWENKGQQPVHLVATDVLHEKGPAPTTVKAVEGSTLDGPATPERYDDTTLGAVDLDGQIPGVTARQLRTRRVTIKPGGTVPVHGHADRPAMLYVTRGEVVEHRSDAVGSVTHKAGDLSKAEDGVAHWWRNETDADVAIIVTDVFNTTAAGTSGQ